MKITIPAPVLSAWSCLKGSGATRIATGLINETYRLDTDTSSYILQRLHPVFSPRVNIDIQAVSAELIRQGLDTPEVLPTDTGSLWCEHEDQVWRLLTCMPGHTVSALGGQKMAFEAGRMAARFHTALGDFKHDYQSGRSHVHDTTAHLKNLSVALINHDDHLLHDQVSTLARQLLESADRHEQIDALPLRHCHGDLKVSNIMFDNQHHAICLIDLDTVNRMAWPLEMGDALRSWCNPKSEDRPGAGLNLQTLDAVLSGYSATMPPWLTNEEKLQLVNGLSRICLELSARFLADALNENYFGWDAKNYPTRGHHNLARGKAMSVLHDDVITKRDNAEKLVRDWLL